MKPLSPELLNAYMKALGPLAAMPAERGQNQKWLRYDLDFCTKYRHPPRDPDSLEPFLQKLASKNQSVAYQGQAARCVSVYYEVVKNWDTVHAGPPAPTGAATGARDIPDRARVRCLEGSKAGRKRPTRNFQSWNLVL